MGSTLEESNVQTNNPWDSFVSLLSPRAKEEKEVTPDEEQGQDAAANEADFDENKGTEDKVVEDAVLMDLPVSQEVEYSDMTDEDDTKVVSPPQASDNELCGSQKSSLSLARGQPPDDTLDEEQGREVALEPVVDASKGAGEEEPVSDAGQEVEYTDELDEDDAMVVSPEDSKQTPPSPALKQLPADSTATETFPSAYQDIQASPTNNDGVPSEGVELTKAKETIQHSLSLTTVETMTTDCSSPAEGSLASKSATNLDSAPPCVNENPPRKRRCIVAIVALALVVIILLASLGATGHFQRDSQSPAQPTQVGTGADPENFDANNGDGADETGWTESDEEETDWPSDYTLGNKNTTFTNKPDTTQLELRPATYVPGLLTVEENGLLLSQGLTSRLIAERNRPVPYANGQVSVEPFHRRPDYGATFPVPPDATENQGGWVYVSNSEIGNGDDEPGLSGVGAIYFDKDGNVIDYKMLLTNTTKNCAGGRTSWGTFISCEEARDIGQVWQIDPFNRRPAERCTMGKVGGRYEAFAYDDRNKSVPRFFVTEDLSNGPTLRWTPDPDSIDWEQPWEILTGNGTLEYLLLNPDPADNNTSGSSGTFEWTRNLTLARENAKLYAQGTEGIDRKDNLLYFVCKTEMLFYILDLDKNTFVMYPANVGLFDGEPDQVKRIVNDTKEILYFTEESESSGIHGRNTKGQFFTIMEGPDWSDATTGLSFSPNGLHMYVAFQDDGVLFDITRDDGYPFHGMSLEVHYHNPPIDHLLRI